MKINHTSEVVMMDVGSFASTLDGIYRYETVIDYGVINQSTPFYEIQDLWTNESHRYSFSIEDEKTILEEIETEINKLVQASPIDQFQQEVEAFRARPTPILTDQLKDELFDAWLYNNDVFEQVCTFCQEEANTYQQNKKAKEDFYSLPKYYYNRRLNSIEWLEPSQVMHLDHFWIQVYHEGCDVEGMVKQCFGEQFAEWKLQSYFNRVMYNKIARSLMEANSEQLLLFKRRLAESWLTYTNQHFIIPPSFANRTTY